MTINTLELRCFLRNKFQVLQRFLTIILNLSYARTFGFVFIA